MPVRGRAGVAPAEVTSLPGMVPVAPAPDSTPTAALVPAATLGVVLGVAESLGVAVAPVASGVSSAPGVTSTLGLGLLFGVPAVALGSGVEASSLVMVTSTGMTVPDSSAVK